MDPQPALLIRGLRKSYGGQAALQDVDLEVSQGEIHALLGENGAGKSTLIKILAGVVRADGGTIEVSGVQLPAENTPSDAAAAGVAFVHQELGLVGNLSVAENVALVTGYERRWRLIDHRATVDKVADLLRRFGIAVDPTSPVASLDQDQKVMVAVARALSVNAQVIVLDEVSASLPAPEMARLAEALRTSRDRGASYVFVTHRLEEVFDIGDRATVLRDGRVRSTAKVSETSHEEVVQWIVGDAVEAAHRSGPSAAHGQVRLSVTELLGPGLSAPCSFDVAQGEVLGVCGLTGSGTRALARLLAGAMARSAGSVLLDGEDLPNGDRAGAVARGVGFVPGDRQSDSAAAEMSVAENLFLRRGRTPRTRDSWWFTPRAESALALRRSEELGVRPSPDPLRRLDTLSGGNQQKVMLGRSLRTEPLVLVLEDPTVGVDVGARVDLHRLVQAAAAAGCAVVLASSDYEEIASQSDRVLVMVAGAVSAEVTGADITVDNVAVLSYGSAA